jgi:hypothetical protein
MGFQLAYHGISDQTFVYTDTTNIMCRSTDIVFTDGQYIKDVQVSGQDSTNQAVSVRFILNDDTEYICGQSGSTMTSIMTSAASQGDNYLLFLSGALNDNGYGLTTEPYAENYLVDITSIYIDINDFDSSQTGSFTSQIGATFTSPYANWTETDGSVQYDSFLTSIAIDGLSTDNTATYDDLNGGFTH